MYVNGCAIGEHYDIALDDIDRSVIHFHCGRDNHAVVLVGALGNALLNLGTLAVGYLVGSVHNAVKSRLCVDVVEDSVFLLYGQFGVIDQRPRIFIHMEHIVFGFRTESVLNCLIGFLHTQGDSVHISLHCRVALFKASVQLAALLILALRLCLLRGRLCGLLTCLFGEEPFKIRLDNRLLRFGALARHLAQDCIDISASFLFQNLADCFGAIAVCNVSVALNSVIKELNQLPLRFGHVLVACLDSAVDSLDGCRVGTGRHFADSGIKHHVIGNGFLESLTNVHRVEFCLTHDVVGFLLGFLLVLERATGNDLAIGGHGVDGHTSVCVRGGCVPSNGSHWESAPGKDVVCFCACGLADPAILHEFFH